MLITPALGRHLATRAPLIRAVNDPLAAVWPMLRQDFSLTVHVAGLVTTPHAVALVAAVRWPLPAWTVSCLALATVTALVRDNRRQRPVAGSQSVHPSRCDVRGRPADQPRQPCDDVAGAGGPQRRGSSSPGLRRPGRSDSPTPSGRPGPRRSVPEHCTRAIGHSASWNTSGCTPHCSMNTAAARTPICSTETLRRG